MPIWKLMYDSISDNKAVGSEAVSAGRTPAERDAVKRRRVNRLERRWWGRAAVNAFICWHLFALAIWLLPSSSAVVQSPLGVGLVRPYMTLTAFAQSWNMFAPYPDKLDVTLEARILYADGETRSWYFPRMASMGYVRRYQEQRWRKIVEVATHGSTQVLWGSLARYAARVNDYDSQNRPVSVALFTHSRQIPAPGLPLPPLEVQPLESGGHVSVTPIRPEDLKN